MITLQFGFSGQSLYTSRYSLTLASRTLADTLSLPLSFLGFTVVISVLGLSLFVIGVAIEG